VYFHPGDSISCVPSRSILEYMTRDDADRAVKDLDGKELRGSTVRVHIDETVCICLPNVSARTDLRPAWWPRQLPPG
jgi:hypothetical protein